MEILVRVLASSAAFFLQALQWMVLAHVVVSWMSALTGRYLFVRPLEYAARTLYAQVRRLFPTSVGPFDFAPVAVLLACQVLEALVLPFSR